MIARRHASRWLPVTEAVMDRALEVIAMIATRGQHRIPIPDVITPPPQRTTVLHVDSDYDHIATVTGQPTRRLPTAN